MKILVTGGSGFIGINLIEKLIKEGIDVLNIDLTGPPNVKQIKFYRKVDINEYNIMYEVIKNYQPDYVIHLAARTDLNGTSMKDYETNYIGTKNLIKAINNTPNVKKIIYASTMLVCKLNYSPKFPDDYCPENFYGESKVEMEKLIRSTNHTYAEWVIVRPTSIWGPWFKEPYRSFFDMIYSKTFFDIGKMSSTKTYGYVENSVYQIVKLLFNSETNSNTYYLGDYEPIFISDWAKEISLEIHNKEPVILPFFLFKFAAILGDLLKSIKIPFPMTSFRLKNMTTNNITDLSETYKLVGKLPIERKEGIENTLKWLNFKK